MTGAFAREEQKIMANKKVNIEAPQTPEVAPKKKRYATHLTTPRGERVYVSAKSEEELKKKVEQLKLEMGVGVDITDNSLFNDYADLWLRIYKKPHLRQNTYDGLQYHLDHLVKPFFANRKLRDVKPLHIQEYLASISHYSNAVQSKCFQIVKAVLNTALDNDLILKTPVKSSHKPGGAKTAEKEPLSNAQASQLLETVKGTRAYLFCLLALSTGMRRGEMLGLMWEDVDFDTGFIEVNHSLVFNPHKHRNVAEVTKFLKSDAARRRLPMPLLLRYELEKAHRESRSPYVFSMTDGKPLSRNSYDSLWRTVVKRCVDENHKVGDIRKCSDGTRPVVSLDFHVHPHLLRHTYITQLFEAGLDVKQVQYLAGHSKPEVTMEIYTHYRRKAREHETARQVNSAVAYLGENQASQPLRAVK